MYHQTVKCSGHFLKAIHRLYQKHTFPKNTVCKSESEMSWLDTWYYHSQTQVSIQYSGTMALQNAYQDKNIACFCPVFFCPNYSKVDDFGIF